jgi:hypothetical protein
MTQASAIKSQPFRRITFTEGLCADHMAPIRRHGGVGGTPQSPLWDFFIGQLNVPLPKSRKRCDARRPSCLAVRRRTPGPGGHTLS